MSVGIVISTYGNMAEWRDLGLRAMGSALCQTVSVPVVWEHKNTLAEARNSGINSLDVDNIICLDADDQLDPGYVEAMLAIDGDIRRPATLGVYSDGSTDVSACLIPRRDISISNYIVIGAMFPKRLFEEVGGFRELDALEDWDLWIRMILEGATVVDVPDATYRVGVREASRNSPTNGHGQAYSIIRSTYKDRW